MSLQDSWSLKGVFYECCRMEGHCPLWFGRDLWDKPCTNLITYQITEGHVGNLDMEGINIIIEQTDIGPRFVDLDKPNKEGAIYISDTVSKEQKKVLEEFTKSNLRTDRWKRNLGTKFVNISLQQSGKTYHIIMPFGEQHLTLTTGGDGKTPVRIENAALTFVTNIKAANADFWKYHDYRKNMEYHNTSGLVADFAFHGN